MSVTVADIFRLSRRVLGESAESPRVDKNALKNLVSLLSAGKREDAKKALASIPGETLRSEYAALALCTAVSNGFDDVVELMLGKGVEPNNTTAGYPAVSYAARKGFSRIIKTLVDHGADVDAYDSVGMTALMRAAEQGLMDSVKALVAAGANVNAEMKTNRCPVICYALMGGSPNVVRFLLKNGAKTNVNAGAAYDYKTPMHLAAEQGSGELIKELAHQKRKQVEEKDSNGNTPLHTAAENGSASAVNAILKAGAKPNVRNKEGKTAAEVADYYGNERAARAIRSWGGK